MEPIQSYNGKYYLLHPDGARAAHNHYATYAEKVELDGDGVACTADPRTASALMVQEQFMPFAISPPKPASTPQPAPEPQNAVDTPPDGGYSGEFNEKMPIPPPKKAEPRRKWGRGR